MNKKTVAVAGLLALSATSTALAQTQDISVIIAPSTGYTWWNKSLNFGQSPMVGVRAGFGIGPLLEARGVYERSLTIKKLSNTSSTQIKRVGGELKLNLWSNALLTPYLTAGAGVMTMQYKDATLAKDYKEEQLYSALGAGLKINLDRRIALSLEAKDYIFNVDANNRYLAAGAKTDKALHNFGAQASLDFYLGGGTYSKDAITRAYRNDFGNGFRGAKFAIEPGIAYVDFGNKSLFKDTYLLGGSAGVDFGQYIGLRAFYYQGIQDPSKLSIKFVEDIKMYGGNLMARLNVSRGVTPYLTLGAGYLDVSKKYVDTSGGNNAKSGWFAIGGAGIEVPLHRHLALYGQANLMLNEQDNLSLSKVTNPEEVKTNWLVQAGLRFNIGARSRSGEALYQAHTISQVNAEREANNRKLNNLRQEHQDRLDSLNNELQLAIQNQDARSIGEITEEIKVEAKEVERAEQVVTEPAPSVAKTITLSKSQLEDLVNQVVAKRQSSNIQLTDFDRLLLISALRGNAGVAYPPHQELGANLLPAPSKPEPVPTQPAKQADNAHQVSDLLNRIDQLERRLENKITETKQEIQVAQDAISFRPVVSPSRPEVVELKAEVPSYLSFRSVDVLGGFGFGQAFTGHLAVRPTWAMGKSNFSFSPDLYYILAPKSNGYSVGANVLYHFGKSETATISPYAGLGLGYSNFSDRSLGGVILTGGITLNKLLGGKVVVDLSLRPAIQHSFVSVGYRFKF